ncbi:MAG: DUF2490 domain-containing protein [Cyclobacteriaceae bacterium]|nr:DUF2490 domain-containing protein [Cyclobacteriaceae bacterium]
MAHYIKSISLVFALSLAPFLVQAQEQNAKYRQLWADFMVQKTFKNSLRYFGEFGPRVLINEKNGWSQLELNQQLQYNVFWKVDAIGGLLMNNTQQTDTTELYDSYEIRPWLGFRLHFNPNSKLMVSLLSRLEQRYLFYNNIETTQESIRLRNRLEFTYSINQPNFYQDKLWYVTLDGEWYFPLDENPGERFANQGRIRAGIGYRQNYNWRYVIVFMEQFSRNTIDEGFKSSNFIVDLRVHFFIPAKINE